MTYTFSGQFCGFLAPSFVEPLADVTVRLYKYRGTDYISSLTVTDPRETMKVLSDDAISAKASALIAEVTTDPEGKFVFVLDEQAGYKGEAFDIDIYLTSVPGCQNQAQRKGQQITLVTIKPRWQVTDTSYSAEWECCLPVDFWRDIRAHFDAWVICGRVIAQETQQPLSGLRIRAFDADWLQDDELGSTLTDGEGKFRIDYERADFTRTFLSPVVNYEQDGPDLYFSVGTQSGRPLLNELKSQGYTPDRTNVDHCFFVEFSVEALPDPSHSE